MATKIFNGKLLVISYYTKGTKYANYLPLFVNYLNVNKIDYEIDEVQNFGTWARNEQYKPEFILNKIEKYPNRKIVFVDIDSQFLKYPEFLFKVNTDLGIRFSKNNEKVFTSTILLHSNKRVKEFFKVWKQLTKRNGNKKFLARNTFYFALKTVLKKEKIKVINIPPEYCYDLFELKQTFPNITPIIHNRKAGNVQEDILEISKIESENEDLIFFIPARKGSKGLPFKNRRLFASTISSIPIEYRKQIIVSTDDEDIMKQCREYNIGYYRRLSNLSNDEASVNDVIDDYVTRYKISNEKTIVLLYLTYPERTWKKIKNALEFFEAKNGKSMLCRKAVKSNPYLCMYDKGDYGKQVIEHNLYRRQDYEKVFEISHFIGIFKPSEIKNLNKNLYNKNTLFYRINDVVDVDTKDDLKKLQKIGIIDYRELETPLMSLEHFKNYIFNKRIALVANSSKLLGLKFGEEIDEHDIVIRFNSYKLKKEDTGEKTDVHCAIWKQHHNFNEYVKLRVIFAGNRSSWNKFMKTKATPEQEFFLDIFWPKTTFNFLRNKNFVPTSGFNMLQVLLNTKDFKEINMYGFDFYENGNKSIFRIKTSTTEEEAPSKAHDYKLEKNWILDNAKNIDEENFIITF